MELKASQSKSLRNRLSKLLFDNTMSDVTFLIGDPPKLFHCHRLILATGSKAFEAMLFGKMAEKSNISIPDVTSRAFENILRYLYTDEVLFKNELDALRTAYAAKKYLMRNLFEICESYLLSQVTIDIESVFLLHEEAAFLQMRRLRDRCLFYLSRNARRAVTSRSFLSASLHTLREFLKLDYMQLDSEMAITEAIWSWGVERCREKGMKRTSKNVRSVAKDLLKYIRFLSLNSEELERVFENYPFLDESEELAILWNIAMPNKAGNSKMPSNLCDMSKKRSDNNLSNVKMHAEYRYDFQLTNYSVKQLEQRVDIRTEGPEIVVVGVVIEMKVIPCYSSSHRHLSIEISICNETTNICTTATSCLRASESQRVFLNDYIAFSEGDVGQLTYKIEAEGVRLMECAQRKFSRKIKESVVTFSFVDDTSGRIALPIHEIICLPNFLSKKF